MNDPSGMGGWAAPPQQQQYQQHQYQQQVHQQHQMHSSSSPQRHQQSQPHYSQQQQQYQSQQQPPQQQQRQPPPQQQKVPLNNSMHSNVSTISRTPDTTQHPRGDIIPTTADKEFEDGRVQNQEAATKIRDAWIYTQISARAKEFTQYKNVSISDFFHSSFADLSSTVNAHAKCHTLFDL